MENENTKQTEENALEAEGDSVQTLVMLAPNSDGWWWCKAKGGMSGDELCLEVTSSEGGNPLIHFGRDHDHIHPGSEFAVGWFEDMEWVKAKSPFA